jgi:hypothetical protein
MPISRPAETVSPKTICPVCEPAVPWTAARSTLFQCVARQMSPQINFLAQSHKTASMTRWAKLTRIEAPDAITKRPRCAISAAADLARHASLIIEKSHHDFDH